ncbi:TonB-dependent receptor domain-containing protein [Epilithonimonas tenax]|uniref:TonB-dependent receptor domain-containing protein n=1 Tax=Epilithonimonas tenax TaxID=191577 RepID=UPI000411A119|nr:TonB-dependent receptor [Epilithonimonas tenax]
MKIKSTLVVSLLCTSQFYFSQETPKKESEKQIETVTIAKTKKAVEQKADRTIFDFSDQAYLTTGNLSEGLKKLPGLIISDVAGMMYQGKQLDVYMDGRPLNIGSNDLNTYLEGMPANSVERVEVITQPGAEFPATSGGAIINIITNKNAKNYLSATYSGRYSFTNDDQWRNRTNNSLLLNAKNRYFGWQLNFGQNYRENYTNSVTDAIAQVFSERIQRGYFLKSAVTFDIGKDRLLVNYDVGKNNNDNQIHSSGYYPQLDSNLPTTIVDYTTRDQTNNENLRQEASATYQIKFNNKSKKLDINATYNRFDTDFQQNGVRRENNAQTNYPSANSSQQDVGTLRMDYSQPIKLLDEGKLSFGGIYEKLNFEAFNGSFTNLDYSRQTASSYLELQTRLKKFDFILGLRAEDYDISGTTKNTVENEITESELTPFKQFRFFPNATVQYNFAKQVYLMLNYNKKIQLPNINSLNPNNTNYQNGSIQFGGNPNLQPTVFNNFEAKISAFDYAFVGYNVSVASNQNAQIAEKFYPDANNKIIDGRDAFTLRNSFVNLSEMRIHNFNFGMPIPFMLFTKGVSETLKMNINPDTMNFLYVYAAYQVHDIPDFKAKGFWTYNLMAQLILPQKIKFVATYNNMTKGNWFYYFMEKPWYHSLDLTATKKFMKDQLSVSIFANDVLKTQENAVRSVYKDGPIFLGNRFDAQNFGISFNYKIPTRNKLAKENPNLLKKDKQDDGAGIGLQ